MRIAVVGARGQLGAAVVHECAAHEVVPFTRADLDVTDDRAIARAMDDARPDAIVNCAAYNMVDDAEDHPVDALNVNALAVRAMAAAADRLHAAFVHYGSDFVFDGRAAEPYTEDAPPSPCSAYGASKMLGEWFALEAARGYVLRVETLFGQAPGGPAPKGSVAKIADGLRAGSSPPVFEDRTISPTFVIDAARATRLVLERGIAPGLYHCVNSGQCTWLELARELARLLGVPPAVKAVRVGDLNLRAQRPQYCALSNEKLRRAGIGMPEWQESLALAVRHDLAHEVSNRQA
jgi:dTDP-4-dehydrorhamnose reductase